MRLHIEVTPKDAAAIRKFFDHWAQSPMVVKRAQRNVEGQRDALTEKTLWHAIVTCLLTTQQQRSGRNHPSRSSCGSSRSLSPLSVARRHGDVRSWAGGVLSSHGGIRRYNQLANEVAANLEILDSGGFGTLLTALRPLEKSSSKAAERAAAHLLDEMLAGVGPKQARNTLQSLGLSQYEIPLDSRVAKWLRRIGFPLPVAAAALSDPEYYDFVLDAFQDMAAAVDVLPCLLDAAIFASFDPAWTEAEVVW
ncbi:MAG: hypothetical protein IPJ56_09965 [Gemmatimonadetes bacterium]|nr:hypothetical protein [Gemmatimonadota bacterium]